MKSAESQKKSQANLSTLLPKDTMTLNSHRTAILAAVGIATWLLASPYALALDKAGYQSAKAAIAAEYKAEKSKCVSLAGNTKDVCMEEAKGKEAVGKADLEYAYTRKSEDGIKARNVKAKSTYAIAKEKCDDLAGNVKDVCTKEAKAVEVKALAEAHLEQETTKSKGEAAHEIREAEYKLALEKCDALSGNPKSLCTTQARQQFPK